MEVKIYEREHNEQKGIQNWQDLMTEEEYQCGEYYLERFRMRQMEMSENKVTWDRIEELAACQRQPDANDPHYPNSFIAILTPVIEGQVASIIEGNIEITHVTDNPAHQKYMVQYDAASAYARRKNRFLEYFKDYTRQYDKLGNSIITVSWDKGYSKKKGKPNGYPKLTVCPLLSVVIDGRVKDAKEIQDAEYIIHEIGFQTIGWARDTFGDEKADALAVGYNRYEGEKPDVSVDDNYTFTLLHVWTRANKQKNLQLIQMDANGFILDESDPSEPYYDYVDNEYPFFFSRMIPITGQLYGYGDGALLKGIQEQQNNLADEVEIACRFNAQPKIIVDPRAHMSADEYNSNPADIGYCNNPDENIKIITGPGINPVVQQTMLDNETRAQRITRFNDIMTGNQQGVSATATQINSQLMQGSVGINDKKSDISRAMEWADRYSLKLCMQYWDKPFWSTMGHNYQTFVDMKDMIKAPSAVPVSNNVLGKVGKGMKDFMGRLVNPRLKSDLAKDADDNLILTDIDWDTQVFIGKGIAKGKTDLFNILMGLAGVILMNQDGTRRMAITPKRWIELMEQTLGMKLSAEDEEQIMDGMQFDQAAITGLNPIGQNDTIQKPQQTPDNLMSTVPKVAGNDNRRLV